MKLLSCIFFSSITLLFISQILHAQDSLHVLDAKMTVISKTPPPPPPSGLKVSAYLVYKDGSISKFDILNDRTIALWNTIIGDTPSEKTRISLSGQLKDLKLIIYNGKRKVINKKLRFDGEYDFFINDTGCEEVKVIITKLNKVIYKNKILFRCGE